jgi:hypothetical protein
MLKFDVIPRYCPTWAFEFVSGAENFCSLES